MYAFYDSMKLDTSMQYDFLPINVKKSQNKQSYKDEMASHIEAYCGFGNFRVTFISRFFHFRIIREFLNLRACIRVVGHFCGLKISTLCISCERQINVMHRIVVHAVRLLKLELYSSFCLHKETIAQFVTHTDSHWTASEPIIR